MQRYPIDWTSVTLLHGTHLAWETSYLEQLAHRVAADVYGRNGAVLLQESDSLTVNSSATAFEVQLRQCLVVSPNGYPIQIHRAEPVQASWNNTQILGDHAIVYLGILRKGHSKPLQPSQNDVLLECQALQDRYVLTLAPQQEELDDHFPIAQVRKSGPEFVLDKEFIPTCAHLSSHPALQAAIDQIEQTAEKGLEGLQKKLLEHKGEPYRPWRTQIATLARPLAAAAVINRAQSPFNYISAVLPLIRELKVYLHSLEQTDSRWQAALRASEIALKRQEALRQAYPSGLPLDFWGPTLKEIREALQCWADLVGALSPFGGAAAARTASDSTVTINPITIKS